MEEKSIRHLTRELKLKEFQFKSIVEFSETIYSSFQVDGIMRIFFSTMMGQLGVSRIFFYDSKHQIFQKRGFLVTKEEKEILQNGIEKISRHNIPWFSLNVEDLHPELVDFKVLLLEKKIQYLVNISDHESPATVIGLGSKLSNKDFTTENIEYSYFVSKFSAGAVENAILINKLIETQRMEHEFKIARQIQLSLLPQSIPVMENFEFSVIYEPIYEVGGDYYDILNERRGELPILIADVEGKGVSAALLAASSQAIFRSMNELYFFEPKKFMAKANSLICDLTRGNRFITLFWMLVNDAGRSITYVNAGHVDPFLISGEKITRLSTGGMITGFVNNVEYESETLNLQPGDIIVSFTDGVPEVENKKGEEFGVDALADFLVKHRHLSAKELSNSLYKEIQKFSQNTKFRDDFTLILIKAK